MTPINGLNNHDSRKVIIVNPYEAGSKFLLSFADGPMILMRLVCYAASLEKALDVCVDWIAEHNRGYLSDDVVQEIIEEGIARGLSSEDAWAASTTDMTLAGDSCHAINSWEWTGQEITREELLYTLSTLS